MKFTILNKNPCSRISKSTIHVYDVELLTTSRIAEITLMASNIPKIRPRFIYFIVMILSLNTYADTHVKKTSVTQQSTFEIIVQLNEPALYANDRLLKSLNNSETHQAKQRIVNPQKQFMDILAQNYPTLKIRSKYYKVFNGFALSATHSQIDTLKRLAVVKKVHLVENKTLPPINTQITNTTVTTAGRMLQKYTGKGITVAVLDSGIDYTHPDLGGCFGKNCKVKGGYNFLDANTDPIDSNGHGTHVAGVIAANGQMQGIAPDAQLLAYKVCNKTCPVSAILQALEHALDPDGNPATDDAADVINMSLSGPGSIDDPVTIAVNNIVKQGITVVVAAGNLGKQGPQTIGSPANAQLAITVGSHGPSTNASYDISSFSSQGPVVSSDFQKPDLVAQGDLINSLAVKTGRIRMSGTSMAAPHVAGLVALLKEQYPTMQPAQLKSLVVNSARSIYSPFTLEGNGRLDISSALKSKLVASKSQIMLGKLDRNLEQWQQSQTITITNISKQPVTLAPKIEHDKASDDVSVYVEGSSSVTIAPGKAHTFSIKAELNNSLTYANNFLHQFSLVLSDDFHVPILVLDAIQYSVNSNDQIKESWLYEHDGNGSYTHKYAYQTEYLLRPGIYTLHAWYDLADKHAIIVKTLKISQQDELLLLVSDAVHKVQVNEWLDHQGQARNLEDLEGFGVFFEVVNYQQMRRWTKFFKQSLNDAFVKKPVFVSNVPEEDTFSYAMMFGDKQSTNDNYHLYAWSNSIKGLNKPQLISLNGEQSNTVFNIFAKEQKAHNWYLYNHINFTHNTQVFDTNVSGFETSGRAYDSLTMNKAASFNSDFTVNIHGNSAQSQHASYYKFEVHEQSSANRYIATTPFHFANKGIARQGENNLSQNIDINWQGVFADSAQVGFNTDLRFYDELTDNNGILFTHYINDSILVCDNIIIAKRNKNLSFIDNRILGFTTAKNKAKNCETTQFITLADNYLAGVSAPVVTTQHQLNSQANGIQFHIEHIDYQVQEANEHKDSVELTYIVKNIASSLGNIVVTAELSQNASWQPLQTEQVVISSNELDQTIKMQIKLPPTDTVSLSSLRIKFADNLLRKSILLSDAVVSGGTLNELLVLDSDHDGINDAQDRDSDNDGMSNGYEYINGLNPYDAHDAETDSNNNGVNNVDEFRAGSWSLFRYSTLDSDGDGFVDLRDEFPNNALEWYDFDHDGVGDNSDTDDDNDGYLDTHDDFPFDATEWLDTDSDSLGNNIDVDDDNDGYLDVDDVFPLNANEWLDNDLDRIGDNSDLDDDNDGYLDVDDVFPLNANEWLDSDLDGIGDNSDLDDDNDGYLDVDDVFPFNATEWFDTDKDGLGNNTDTDDDNDSHLDHLDSFPLDSNEWLDTDSDGIGNNQDNDDDNDGYLDDNDDFPLDPTRWSQKVNISKAKIDDGSISESKTSSGGSLYFLQLVLAYLFILRRFKKAA
ncbi:hypothetical protein PSECIP111951_02308 [Pseudoalteromonas holothuriae]|uniref:Peptidase S8/S53 domain-containing protein n=2 Tax=Pseudoalteromonas holothuriae TaxID=2963714 RepID=A0ABM9GJ60_9GAMM|nr:hypothetical protein PSECIP111951_02308 [Pseudoalteromonas sp. CIP111951]